MAMKIDPERLEAGDLSPEEIAYLQDRGQLPPHIQPIGRDERGQLTQQETKRYIEDMSIGDIQAYLDEREAEHTQQVPQRRSEGGELPPEDDSDDEEEDDPETEELLAETYEEGWTNDSRRAELMERGLKNTGTKQELIDRLMRDDRGESTEDDQAEVE